jgi:hypothetical protein
VTQAAYFNVLGQPLTLSAKDAVLAREPRAYATSDEFGWRIKRAAAKRGPHWSNPDIGTGANEESAWREALSRLRLADDEEAARS